jgi:hypothetical protein
MSALPCLACRVRDPDPDPAECDPARELTLPYLAGRDRDLIVICQCLLTLAYPIGSVM